MELNPNNYIIFNNEIWRIVGVMKVQNSKGIIEERLKIVRQNGIEGQKNFGSYIYDLSKNDWITSILKDMLNSIYYNSGIGDCYHKNIEKEQCDFTGNGDQPNGLKNVQNMIDNDIVWNIGGALTSEVTASEYYESERSEFTANINFPNVWNAENDLLFHNGVGLIYPSDFGYAVGLNVQNACLSKDLHHYSFDGCFSKNWLFQITWNWFITPDASDYRIGIYFNADGAVANPWIYDSYQVWPTVYLKNNISIFEHRDNMYGSISNPFQISL